MFIINFISFVLEGIFSVLIDKNSLFVPLFSVASLVLVYPYVPNKKKFVLYGTITGLLYDLVYTQTLFLNTIVFTILALIILLYFKYFSFSLIKLYVLNLMVPCIFRILIFIIQVLAGNVNFEFNVLIISIYTSLISNTIYLFIMSFILKRFFKRTKKMKYI